MSPSNLMLGLLIGCALVWLWWYLAACYEAALDAARRHCEIMGVQFLDGSVIRAGYQLKWDTTMLLKLQQRFVFEFSTTGERRYQGRVNVVGRDVTLLELEAHRLSIEE